MSQTLYCPRCHGPATITTDWKGDVGLRCDAYRPCHDTLVVEYSALQDEWERFPTDNLPTNPNSNKLTRNSGAGLAR